MKEAIERLYATPLANTVAFRGDNSILGKQPYSTKRVIRSYRLNGAKASRFAVIYFFTKSEYSAQFGNYVKGR